MTVLKNYTVETIGKDASDPPKDVLGHYTILFEFDDGSTYRAVIHWPDVQHADHLHDLVLTYAAAYQAGLVAAGHAVGAGHTREVDPDDYARRERERLASPILPDESKPEPT